MTENAQVTRLQQMYIEDDEARYNFCLNEILKTVDGRKFLFHWLSHTRLGQNPFTTNALQTSFNCGEQNVGQKYLAHILSVNPELYVQMQKEANDERSNRDSAIHLARTGQFNFDDTNADPDG